MIDLINLLIMVLKDFNQLVCESGKCIQTNEGFYWLIKRYKGDEMVLQGCGGNEYIYRRNIEY